MKKTLAFIKLLAVFSLAMGLTTCETTDSAAQKTAAAVAKPSPAQTAAAGAPNQAQSAQAPIQPSNPYFTGDGGKGISIAILQPEAVGMAKDLGYLPGVVQGELVSNFSGYSAIEVLDRVALESQYKELDSGYYPDDREGILPGHLPPTTYLMMGKITKTASGYALQITVAKNEDGKTAASYSGSCTVAELDNFTGIRRASLELLGKMGVALTEKSKTELAKAAEQQAVNAQTAMAQGIVAQRGGTVVESLSYYLQSASYDPGLTEAASRVTILTANITSGNMGENIRNDIAWRDQWRARLAEAEQVYANYMKQQPLYSLVYSANLKHG